MISQKEIMYGTVFYRLISNNKNTIEYNYDLDSYIINNNTALYLKYCTKRMTPWGFTFNKFHHDLIEIISKKYTLFLCLICNDDGICCISYKEYKQIVNFKSCNINNISVQRKKRESYQVSGKSGSLNYKISDSDFPKRLFDKTTYMNKALTS